MRKPSIRMMRENIDIIYGGKGPLAFFDNPSHRDIRRRLQQQRKQVGRFAESWEIFLAATQNILVYSRDELIQANLL